MENFKIETRNNVEPERKNTATEFSYILQRQVKKNHKHGDSILLNVISNMWKSVHKHMHGCKWQ